MEIVHLTTKTSKQILNSKWSLCDQLVDKGSLVPDKVYIQLIKQDKEIMLGRVCNICNIIALKAEILEQDSKERLRKQKERGVIIGYLN